MGDVAHKYLYAGGKLLRETYGSNTLDFLYDAGGSPFALRYNQTYYYYITNLQGDVMQIVNASGNVVAAYEYDPYGNIISATGTLAEINPLRYRGYYYDTDTGLYYLQSRYYDPELGRFINADAFASTGQGILGYNMFAYCGNNPVAFCDPTGTKAEFWHKMFEDHDPGYIHRAVQVDILVKYNVIALMYGSEYVMPGIGRADIVCFETGEMWEIKYGGSSAESWIDGIEKADSRLETYLFKGSFLIKGRAGHFSGTFTVEYNASTYLVAYETPQVGVILYTFTRAKEYSPKPDFVYAPYTLYDEIFQTMLALSAVSMPYASTDGFQSVYYVGG